MQQNDGNEDRRYKHIFLDAEGTLYVPKHGRSRWDFWVNPSPDEAIGFFELDEGVIETLKKLREEAETLCLVSRNSEQILGALLDEFKIREYFDRVLLNGDKGKQIEAYLTEKGLRKESAVMVGDMPSLDLYPVWRAGIDALLVDRPYNRQVRAERIRSISELPSWLRIADLAERLERDSVRNTTLDEFLVETPCSKDDTKRLIAAQGE